MRTLKDLLGEGDAGALADRKVVASVVPQLVVAVMRMAATVRAIVTDE